MHKSILAALMALAVLAADQATAQPVNPMRERVRQWELRALENAVGKERAAQVLAAAVAPDASAARRAQD